MARQEFADWYDAIDSDEYSKLDIAQAAWDAALASMVENDSSPNSESAKCQHANFERRQVMDFSYNHCRDCGHEWRC